MLNDKGFDKWSGNYDESIANSIGYPFEGYYDVLGEVQSRINISKTTKILDLGVGTGLLSSVLYENGAEVVGLDFSEGMIKEAKVKMPKARFIQQDLNLGLPEELEGEKFDYIVSSYAIHHICDDSKVKLLKQLERFLKPSGVIIIADVAFKSKADLQALKAQGHQWDEDEYYFCGDDMMMRLKEMNKDVSYKQISVCAGILEIK